MGLTAKQTFYKCCGFFCAGMSCIGVYFFTVMSYFQSQSNAFMMEELEGYRVPSDDGSKFTKAFIICIVVSATPML